jgi:hypothetical protein
VDARSGDALPAALEPKRSIVSTVTSLSRSKGRWRSVLKRADASRSTRPAARIAEPRAPARSTGLADSLSRFAISCRRWRRGAICRAGDRAGRRLRASDDPVAWAVPRFGPQAQLAGNVPSWPRPSSAWWPSPPARASARYVERSSGSPRAGCDAARARAVNAELRLIDGRAQSRRGHAAARDQSGGVARTG